MPRTNLDKGLQELQGQIKQLNLFVKDMFTKTLGVLETGEEAILHEVAEAIFPLNVLSYEVERQALRLLILQQPLGGQDLRLLTAILHISEALRQIGEASCDLALTLTRVRALYQRAGRAGKYSVHAGSLNQESQLTDAFLLRGLLLLGEEVEYIFSQAMDAFVSLNVADARKIINEQNLLETRYTPLCQDIFSVQARYVTSMLVQEDSTFLQRMAELLWMAHKLAEIANHVMAICKRIIFIMEA